jgi:hypothetical protein
MIEEISVNVLGGKASGDGVKERDGEDYLERTMGRLLVKEGLDLPGICLQTDKLAGCCAWSGFLCALDALMNILFCAITQSLDH